MTIIVGRLDMCQWHNPSSLYAFCTGDAAYSTINRMRRKSIKEALSDACGVCLKPEHFHL